MNEKLKPIVPLGFLQDLFSECGGETLHRGLARPDSNEGDNTALDTLYSVIRFFNEARAEARAGGGLVSTATNAKTVDMMLAGFDAMRHFGALED